MKINVLLVEDDPVIASQVKDMLTELDYCVLAVCKDKQAARRVFAASQPHILITDIHLTERLDGIELGKLADSNNIPVIFMTQYADDTIYALTQSLKNSTFLVKPFHKLTLNSQISILLKKRSADPRLQTNPKHKLFAIYNRSWDDVVFLKDIYWLEADGNYSIIKTETNVYSIKKSLVLLEKTFPRNTFIRISRSYFVHINYINKIDIEARYVIIAQRELTIGRHYTQLLKDELNRLEHTDS